MQRLAYGSALSRALSIGRPHRSHDPYVPALMRRSAESALASNAPRDAGDGSAPPDLARIAARAADAESAAAELTRAVLVAFPGLLDAVASTGRPPDAIAAHFNAPGAF